MKKTQLRSIVAPHYFRLKCMTILLFYRFFLSAFYGFRFMILHIIWVSLFIYFFRSYSLMCFSAVFSSSYIRHQNKIIYRKTSTLSSFFFCKKKTSFSDFLWFAELTISEKRKKHVKFAVRCCCYCKEKSQESVSFW